MELNNNLRVSYLSKPWIYIICICVSVSCRAGQTSTNTNLEIVRSLSYFVINSIPEADTLHIVLDDSSQTGFYVQHCIIRGLQERNGIILKERDDHAETSLSLSVFALDITYRQLKRKNLSKHFIQRNIKLVLNIGVSSKGEIISDSLYTTLSCDTLSAALLPYIEQQGRILGNGIFIDNNRRSGWIEPVLALLVISGIGSLFYWVRSN